MNRPDDQAMLLGALVGMSAATAAAVGFVIWFFRARA